MSVRSGIVALSAAGVVASLAIPALSDLLIVAGPSFLAGLLLVFAAWRQRRAIAPAAARNPIVVDGSNVMHWNNGTPHIDTVREVATRLTALGFTPGFVFDANAGYKLFGKYLDDPVFARLLGLPEDRVVVVPKGTPADSTVLAAARELDARVVSNDRFRDWSEAHPEVSRPGYLVPGGYRDGELWLKIDDS